jgi:hypothetical protein
LGERKREVERRSDSGLTLRPYSAAVCLDDAARDREAESNAAAVGMSPLPKGFEELLDLAWTQTGSCVGDKYDRVVVLGQRAKPHLAVTSDELDRVADQVAALFTLNLAARSEPIPSCNRAAARRMQLATVISERIEQCTRTR